MLVTRPNVSVLDPQEQGAFPPPLGITPNFVNPSSIATGFQAGFGVCVGISGLFVIARTYTRICVMKRWGLEDCQYPSVAGYCQPNFCLDFMWLSWVGRSEQSFDIYNRWGIHRLFRLFISSWAIGQCPMELACISGMSMWWLTWNSWRSVLDCSKHVEVHSLHVALVHSHDFIQSSHMFHQTRDCDTIFQYICARKDDKKLLGIHESHDSDCDILYRLFISSCFPMHSPGKDLEPKNSRNLPSHANNLHSFGLAERHTRLHHVLGANQNGLAASDVQGEEVGYHSRFRDRIFVGENSSG